MLSTFAAMVIWAACCVQAASADVSQRSMNAARVTPATPDETMARFARLDADGAQLTAGGWETVAALFTTPSQRRIYTRLSIVSDRYVVIKAVMAGQGAAEARADYTHVGFLDVASGVLVVEHAGLYLREPRKLVLLASPPAPPAWKIEGIVPDPHITRTAAIRYVTARLHNPSDKKVAKNLSATLAALKRLR